MSKTGNHIIDGDDGRDCRSPKHMGCDKCNDPEINTREYLGDGVYASFDGYQIWLAVNHHENKVVALEPSVIESLVEYSNKYFK